MDVYLIKRRPRGDYNDVLLTKPYSLPPNKCLSEIFIHSWSKQSCSVLYNVVLVMTKNGDD